MSVTQNYKTITLTDQQHLHVVLTVMTQLRVDNAAKSTPGDEYDKFLAAEIALGVETLAVLNAAKGEALTGLNAAKHLTREDTHGALDGEMLQTVLLALHNQRSAAAIKAQNMRRMFADYEAGELCVPAVYQQDVDTAQKALSDIDAALLFLENPK